MVLCCGRRDGGTLGGDKRWRAVHDKFEAFDQGPI